MLEIKHLSYRVEDESGTADILRDVSLTIDDKRFVVITGPNGGGKTSLARTIMGINPATSGSVFWNGKDITALSVTERARLGISYGFQQPPRFKGMKVRDLLNIAAGAPMSHDEACGYLTKVGLCARDYIDRDVDASLSGGEVKRIEIATVLARRSSLMIFDEPEAGIDLWSFNNLIEVFQDLQKTLNGSMVIISHQERILAIADEIVVIAGGRVTAQGPAQEIMGKLLSGEKSCDSCPKQEVLYGGECHE